VVARAIFDQFVQLAGGLEQNRGVAAASGYECDLRMQEV
jgi:hypothetical protein